MQPPEIEKGAAANDAQNSPFPETAYRATYRCDSRDASSGPLRLVEGLDLKAALLEKAAEQVRQEPSTLPLWCFRLFQHQRLGRLGYEAVWSVLYEAGREVGSDKWVRGCLLHAIGQANSSTIAPPSMQTLLRGGVQ